MRNDGQVLYEAYARARGEWTSWAQLFESERITWEEIAAKLELRFAERMREKLQRMARS